MTPKPKDDVESTACLDVVVGTGEGQVLVATEIPLQPPAFAIKEVVKTFRNVTCTAIRDKVIVTGTLVKDINFKTFEREDCFDTIPRVCGDVRHCEVEIPFSLFVDVRRARPGDRCEVVVAEVEGEIDELREPIPEKKSFRVLLERVVIRVVVRVTRRTEHGWGASGETEEE
ncbi:hypothetical protein SY88_13470 [Clostridiales bacterium PH28_bin88]|nr:hypothetical protein SY88_13470 [Clostridiales bacterium PH28_bin88]